MDRTNCPACKGATPPEGQECILCGPSLQLPADRRSKYAIPQGKPAREYVDLMGRRWADPQDATPMLDAAGEALRTGAIRGKFADYTMSNTFDASKLPPLPDGWSRIPLATGDKVNPKKPHYCLRVKLGASSRMPLWTVTEWGKEPWAMTTWRARCAQATDDATRRTRLGLGL